jgi:hypothetical protein
MKHALFKESEKNIMYCIIKSTKYALGTEYEKYLLYKVDIVKYETLFDSKLGMQTISNTSIDYNGTVGYS